MMFAAGVQIERGKNIITESSLLIKQKTIKQMLEGFTLISYVDSSGKYEIESETILYRINPFLQQRGKCLHSSWDFIIFFCDYFFFHEPEGADD